MQTLFYFSDVSQLADFEDFKVQPVADSHSRTVIDGEIPKFWSVVGTLKKDKSEGVQGRHFPVADLPSELYAGLFASLCEQLTDKA